jgi:hypothetical protein
VEITVRKPLGTYGERDHACGDGHSLRRDDREPDSGADAWWTLPSALACGRRGWARWALVRWRWAACGPGCRIAPTGWSAASVDGGFTGGLRRRSAYILWGLWSRRSAVVVQVHGCCRRIIPPRASWVVLGVPPHFESRAIRNAAAIAAVGLPARSGPSGCSG